MTKGKEKSKVKSEEENPKFGHLAPCNLQHVTCSMFPLHQKQRKFLQWLFTTAYNSGIF